MVVSDSDDLAVSANEPAKYFVLPGGKHYMYFVVAENGTDPKETYNDLTAMTGIKLNLAAGTVNKCCKSYCRCSSRKCKL